MRNDLARGSADGKGCQAEFKANVYSALCIFRLVDKYTEAELRRSTKGPTVTTQPRVATPGQKKRKKYSRGELMRPEAALCCRSRLTQKEKKWQTRDRVEENNRPPQLDASRRLSGRYTISLLERIAVSVGPLLLRERESRLSSNCLLTLLGSEVMRREAVAGQ